jgi:hypothetical protein
MFSCKGTQKILQPWCEEAKPPLKLVADFGVHYPCDTGFAGMHNAGVMALWRLPLRFQREAWEARQCVKGSESCRQFLKGKYMKL